MKPVRGVFWEKRSKKWRVKYGKDKKRINLGLYESLADANAAREKADKDWGVPLRAYERHNPDITKLIADLALQGMTGKAIAAKTGIPMRTVNYRITRMVQTGKLSKAHERKIAAGVSPPRRRKFEVKLGCLSDVIRGMSEEQITWLVSQVPKGGKISDIVRAIVVDAHFEEKGE